MKCPNLQFFVVSSFPHLDWLLIFTLHCLCIHWESVKIRIRKNSEFGHCSRSLRCSFALQKLFSGFFSFRRVLFAIPPHLRRYTNFSNICASKKFLFGSGEEKLSYCYSLYFRCLGHTHTLIFIWRQETFPMFIYKFGFHYGRVCSVGNHKVFINNLWKWGLRLIGHCQTIYKQAGKGNTKRFIGTAH